MGDLAADLTTPDDDHLLRGSGKRRLQQHLGREHDARPQIRRESRPLRNRSGAADDDVESTACEIFRADRGPQPELKATTLDGCLHALFKMDEVVVRELRDLVIPGARAR